jgi:choline dehydrogenase-like flavoprotein
MQDGFDPARLIEQVLRGEADAIYVVPTMLYRLLDHPRVGEIAGRLRMIMYGAAPASPARLREFVLRTSGTIYHPAGTCRMGRGPDAVVDPELRVRGLDGLRVADASIMPTLLSVQTHATCLVIGELAARFLRG